MEVHLLIAFAGGFISFLSPCVLPLIPGYIAYISGGTINEVIEKRRLVLLKTVFFSIGFSIVFISFGITASIVGKFFINYSNQLRIIAGLIIVLFYMQLIGVINLKTLNREARFFTKNYSNNLVFPIIVGAAFGFGWTPCIGPILGSILALASLENNVRNGIILLSFYSLGLAIPFIISGYAVQRFVALSKQMRNFMPYVSKIGGMLLLLTGLLIITNQLQSLGFYILELFPFLSKLG